MSEGLCKYRHIFGKEGEGAHSIRFANVAVVDVVLTFVAAFIIHKIFGIVLWKVVITLFLLGIIMHRMFCVNTTINQLIFGKIENMNETHNDNTTSSKK